MANQFGNLANQQAHGPEYPDLGRVLDGVRAAIPAPREKRAMMLEERAERSSNWALIFLAGYITCAAVNHVQQLWSEHGKLVAAHVTADKVPALKAQAAQVPKLKAEAGCEHWRSGVLEHVAKQGIASANSDAVPVPSTKAIPPDNCQPAAPKK